MDIKRALISVSDKTGIIEFATELEKLGVEIISTGGTLKRLEEVGITVKSISEVTGFPECLDGRVKTLHPSVHGGLLARRDSEKHMKQLDELGIETIDLVVVNLYPFKETILKEGVTLEDAIENIDIGGPTMLRSSAKNYKDVAVVCDTKDYEKVISEIKSFGKVTDEMKYNLALNVFQHTASYDSMIAEYLREKIKGELPETITMSFEKVQDLRYGENPHQKGYYYREIKPAKGSLVLGKQLAGKELSFNNINDTEGALATLKEFDEITAVAVKHANPCGVGTGKTVFEAFEKAYNCDPVSIFGGIVAINREVDLKTAEKLSEIFLEIVLAPSFSEEALNLLKQKKNLRIILISGLDKVEKADEKGTFSGLDIKRVSGGILIQEKDNKLFDGELKIVTKKAPTEEEMKDMIMAMKVAKHIKSNGIVLAKNGHTVGIGPGQVNRIWAVENAIKQSNVDLQGAVMASDAFFPFDDCVETSGKAGITAIIQPGGSIRDEDSIKKADEMGISMVFTGVRHFKH